MPESVASSADLAQVSRIVENLLHSMERLAKEPGMKAACRLYRNQLPEPSALEAATCEISQTENAA